MDKEITDRFEKIEKQLAPKKRDTWEKLQLLTPLLMPLTIALIGLYFTDGYNESQLKIQIQRDSNQFEIQIQRDSNQLEIQRINNDNQIEIAIINSNVGQSELIKDFMQHLTGKDTSARKIAIVAVLYAAPIPGKRIVDIIAESGDMKARGYANDALSDKRKVLVENLFSSRKEVRLIAASEITTSWTEDEVLLSELIKRAEDCGLNKFSLPECGDGVYNTMVVLQFFSKDKLIMHKSKILDLIHKIPNTSKKTLAQSDILKKELE